MKQPFCTPAQALRRVLDAAAALPVPATERVPLDDACGRIAARDLCARMDQPPFDRSPLDGYALHSADTAGAGEETPVTLPVVMKLYAGDAPAAALPAGCAARIMTGDARLVARFVQQGQLIRGVTGDKNVRDAGLHGQRIGFGYATLHFNV